MIKCYIHIPCVACPRVLTLSVPGIIAPHLSISCWLTLCRNCPKELIVVAFEGSACITYVQCVTMCLRQTYNAVSAHLMFKVAYLFGTAPQYQRHYPPHTLHELYQHWRDWVWRCQWTLAPGMTTLLWKTSASCISHSIKMSRLYWKHHKVGFACALF